MALQELQIYGLWAGKQTAKGTPNAAPAKRFKAIAGGFQSPREDGGQDFSDGSQNPNTQDWVNTLVGSGNPGILATPEELSWTSWAFEGGETTAAVAGPPAKTKHTAEPLPGLGHWLTFASRRGSSVIDRKDWVDSQIGQLQIEGSTANKGVRFTPTVVCLDPGVERAADPAAVMPVKPSFIYTDGTGRFKIDTVTMRGHSQFTITLNKDLQPVYSDDVTVYDLGIGNVANTIAVTLYFDVDGRAQWNKLVYGTAAPAAGTKPLKTLSPLGAYEFDLRIRDAAGVETGDKFVFKMAGVKWAVPEAPEFNPDGGSPELGLAGAMRKVAGQPDYSIQVDSDAAAFTV